MSMNFSAMTDPAILAELGRRLRRLRLNRDVTQIDLAARAGVSRSVVQSIERGDDATLGSLLRVLRALGALDQLDAFLPDPGISPLQLARLRGRRRQRASGSRGSARGDQDPGGSTPAGGR